MVRIITDSGSDISQEEAKGLGIRVIPIITLFPDGEYRDGVDITIDDFYERLEKRHEFAKTTQVNPGMYHEAFEEEIKDGNEILCLTLGSRLSGCYQSALIAKNDFPDAKITIIDTYSVCVGQRNLVYLALEDIRKGMNMEETVRHLEAMKKRLVVIASVDTLEYLLKGGRISKTTAFLGSILSIKPVIELQDGVIKMIGKARGYKNAHNMLVKVVEKYGGIDFAMPFACGYSGSDRSMLEKYLESSKPLYENDTKEVPVYRIGSAIGTHCGPGAIAVSFFRKDANE